MSQISRQVAATDDDCVRMYVGAGYWNIAWSTLYAGYRFADSYNWGSAVRFTNITIPPGSVIASAYLTFTRGESRATTVVNTRIRSQNSSNPLTFSTAADFDARSWIDPPVDWDNIPAWTLDTEYSSPNIAACIQAAIDLVGWASGNAMVLQWQDYDQRSTAATNTVREAYDYTNVAAKAAKLIINYTLPCYLWIEGTRLHYIADTAELSFEGTDTLTNATAGHIWIEGTYLHYIDENGDERRQEGTAEGATGQTAGHLWVEATKLRYIDASGDERTITGV